MVTRIAEINDHPVKNLGHRLFRGCLPEPLQECVDLPPGVFGIQRIDLNTAGIGDGVDLHKIQLPRPGVSGFEQWLQDKVSGASLIARSVMICARVAGEGQIVVELADLENQPAAQSGRRPDLRTARSFRHRPATSRARPKQRTSAQAMTPDASRM